MNNESPLQKLMDTLPRSGRVEWIGLRPSKEDEMQSVERVMVGMEHGLEGDRFRGRPGGKRQVTLIQQEHLAMIASCMGLKKVSPALLRRNMVISGLNLLALKGKTFEIGDAVLRFTGLCHPCSKMEMRLGPGGYNAMRGHGGITTTVIQAGEIKVGDFVRALPTICDE